MEKTNKSAPASKKHQTKAFVNWVITSKDGTKKVRSGKGFPLQGHPDYPNKQEDFLISLAEKAKDGVYTGTLDIEIHLNSPKEVLDTSLF